MCMGTIVALLKAIWIAVGWHNSLYPEFKVFPFESNIDKKHVIVIGAGAAGLAAAACLKVRE